MMKKIAPLLEQLNHRILGKYLSFIEAIDGQLPTLHDSIDEEGEDETDDDERPRKKIPNWANMKSTLFRASIMRM